MVDAERMNKTEQFAINELAKYLEHGRIKPLSDIAA
jgi:hypothetical protein